MYNTKIHIIESISPFNQWKWWYMQISDGTRYFNQCHWSLAVDKTIFSLQCRQYIFMLLISYATFLFFISWITYVCVYATDVYCTSTYFRLFWAEILFESVLTICVLSPLFVLVVLNVFLINVWIWFEYCFPFISWR